MSSFQVVDSSPGCSVSIMETSNFAHVIFQNVGKSFLPQAPLECRYTLTPYITPHPKDWVGIFKVGWSTARDYYTFLWSPMPENYEPGSTVHRTVVFQGYYVPKSDGEFYQFCYVTHAGDIRGASTPFQFRSATPTEELLTVTEEDSNSDILVVTTKTGLLEFKRVEEAQQERRELLKAMRLLQEEKQQLQEEQKQLVKEREQERETCCLLRTHNQELLRSSQGLSDEREEVRRRLTEAKDRVRQLEEDLLGVTQRGLQKETELDCLRDRLKKLTAERDTLESQLKNEKDERDLYKVAHLRSTELENTKLSAELQMLKAVELNREVTIAQFQEELERLRACVAQRDSLERELLEHRHDKAELSRLREQLRQAEEQLQASRQQAALLSSELRDSAGARDHTMTELYRARIEADKLRASLADAQAECQRMESQLDRMRSTACKEVGVGTNGDGAALVSEAEAELQREVEELKLRLHMAAEHYKEKYRECQRLRRQVAKLSTAESQVRSLRDFCQVLKMADNLPKTCVVSAGHYTKEEHQRWKPRRQLEETTRKMVAKRRRRRRRRRTCPREKEQTRSVEAELAVMEEKWREQCVINDTLKQRLADEEGRFRVQMAERAIEVSELKQNLAQALKDKEQLQEELQLYKSRQRELEASVQGAEAKQPMVLRYPLPYPQDPSPPPLIPQRPAELQYGNPYSTDTSKGKTEGNFCTSSAFHPGPGAPGWDQEVVCIQPSRSTTPPENMETPAEEAQNGNKNTVKEEKRNTDDNNNKSQSKTNVLFKLQHTASFCSITNTDVHKRCPLCEVIFPPHFEQRSFEQHVESHWKVCPVCSEQFPLNCQQQLFERHVLTHFDGNVLNFE
uniref:Tax1 (human T-cell leukemia virus type I) binding protein 1a n=1 Tax=Poecilia formosa TaxID=48698 RepID=A0A096M3L3_POEFO